MDGVRPGESLDDFEKRVGDDAPEWTEEDFRRARPIDDFPDLKAALERARGQRGPQKAPTKERISLRLDREETHRLLTEAPAAYRTRIDTLLLTAVALAATRRCARDAVTVHVEGHGREALFPDIDIGRTVGWFTSV